MKILKDPDQMLRVMDAQLDELHKRFDEADGEEASEISGQEVAIIDIVGDIRHAIEDHGYFGVEDMAHVCDYVNDAKEKDHEYRNPRDTWFMKGLAKRAAWALKEIERGWRNNHEISHDLRRSPVDGTGGRQDQAGSGSSLPAHEYKRHHGARRPRHRGG